MTSSDGFSSDAAGFTIRSLPVTMRFVDSSFQVSNFVVNVYKVTKSMNPKFTHGLLLNPVPVILDSFYLSFNSIILFVGSGMNCVILEQFRFFKFVLFVGPKSSRKCKEDDFKYCFLYSRVHDSYAVLLYHMPDSCHSFHVPGIVVLLMCRSRSKTFCVAHQGKYINLPVPNSS